MMSKTNLIFSKNTETQQINNIIIQYLTFEQMSELFDINTSLHNILSNNPTYIELKNAQCLLSSSNKILGLALQKVSLKEKLKIDMVLLAQFNKLDTSKKYKYMNSFI
ncbi:hypothetical protein [Pseudoalteromonas sp. '520P1 No. 412']|nr:hypothetical protein [Pseudoalteromonas sp. '520P1 No. 412']